MALEGLQKLEKRLELVYLVFPWKVGLTIQNIWTSIVLCSFTTRLTWSGEKCSCNVCAPHLLLAGPPPPISPHLYQGTILPFVLLDRLL